MRKGILVLGIVFWLLVAALPASAWSGHGGQYGPADFPGNKGGIGFMNGVDPTDFTIEKTESQMRIRSGVHYQTTLQIPYSDLEALEGFTGVVNINHFDDSGVNDWTKTVYPENENGYCYLDLEFSEVIITVGESHLKNWYFHG